MSLDGVDEPEPSASEKVGAIARMLSVPFMLGF